MEDFVDFLVKAFPQYGAKIRQLGAEGIRGELLTIPLRLVATFLLARGFLFSSYQAVHPNCRSTTNKGFAETVLWIGLIYLIDVEYSILINDPFTSFAVLQPFSRLLFNRYPNSFESIVCFVCIDLLYVLALKFQPLRFIALLGFLLLESLTYSFGYTENTFSTFKLFLALGCLVGQFRHRLLLDLLLAIYFVAGLEKVFGFVNLSFINTGVSLFGELGSIEMAAVLLFQLACPLLLLAPFMARIIWIGTAIAFHHIVLVSYGIGGIASPWVVSLIIAFIIESEGRYVKKRITS